MISHQDKPLILIVDDDNIIRRIVREALQVEGFNILEACDGVEAFARTPRSGSARCGHAADGWVCHVRSHSQSNRRREHADFDDDGIG